MEAALRVQGRRKAPGAREKAVPTRLLSTIVHANMTTQVAMTSEVVMAETDVSIAPPLDGAASKGAKRARPTAKADGASKKVLKTILKPETSGDKASSIKAVPGSDPEKLPEDAEKINAEKAEDEPCTVGEMSFVVVKTIKQYLRTGMPEPIHVGGDFIRALNAKIAEDVMQAMHRVVGNGRKTIRGMDL